MKYNTTFLKFSHFFINTCIQKLKLLGYKELNIIFQILVTIYNPFLDKTVSYVLTWVYDNHIVKDFVRNRSIMIGYCFITFSSRFCHESKKLNVYLKKRLERFYRIKSYPIPTRNKYSEIDVKAVSPLNEFNFFLCN